MFHSTLSLDGRVFHWIEEKSLKSTQGPIFLVNARKALVRWNLRGHLFSLSTHHSSRKAVIQLLDRESMLPTHRNRMSACATPSPQWLLLNRISVHLIFTRQYIPSACISNHICYPGQGPGYGDAEAVVQDLASGSGQVISV